jgi:hypothetical protein
MIDGRCAEVVLSRSLSVNIRAGREFTVIPIVIHGTGTTPGSIAITGIATLGKQRVNGAVAVGTVMSAAMIIGGGIDTIPRGILAIGGGTVIVTRQPALQLQTVKKGAFMKTIALGVLFAVGLVSVTGCHWRHRRWRNYHEHSYNSQRAADQLARAQQASGAEHTA